MIAVFEKKIWYQKLKKTWSISMENFEICFHYISLEKWWSRTERKFSGKAFGKAFGFFRWEQINNAARFHSFSCSLFDILSQISLPDIVIFDDGKWLLFIIDFELNEIFISIYTYRSFPQFCSVLIQVSMHLVEFLRWQVASFRYIEELFSWSGWFLEFIRRKKIQNL